MTAPVHPAALPVEQLLAACEIRRTRRSGPGGQHRNKVETAVAVKHLSSGISAEAGERRSQAENRAVAVFRLRLRLAVDVRRPPAGPCRPSPLWQSRSRGGKVAVSSKHDDFPAMLAEALDVVAEHDYDVKAAASVMECTASQLTKLLQQEPRAIAMVNQAREQRGRHRLK